AEHAAALNPIRAAVFAGLQELAKERLGRRQFGDNDLVQILAAEASTDPWRAEEAAKRLAALAPSAGHLVHMPAHIQYRVGQFREAIRQNIFAAQVDENYINIANPSPIYRYGYYTHNLHFVVTSAQQGGDG